MSLVAAVGALSLGCAADRVARLPKPIESEKDEALLAAQARMERAYSHCEDEYQAENIPVPLVLSIASGTSSIALLGVAAAASTLLPEPYDAAGTMGAAIPAVLLGGVSVFFGLDVVPFYARADVRAAAFQKARYDAQIALRTREPEALDRVTRSLYENCRIAVVTTDGGGAATVLRDLQRYRRETDAQRRWSATLEDEKAKREAETARIAKERAAEQRANEKRLEKLEREVETMEKLLAPAPAPPPAPSEVKQP